MYEKVAEGVFLVGGVGYSAPSDCLVYAVDLGELVLIDCGCGPDWQKIRGNIDEAGLDPDSLGTLFLTHAHVDHIGAGPEIRCSTGCKVVAHPLDARSIESGDPKRTAAAWYSIRLKPLRVTSRLSGESGSLKFPAGDLHWLHTPGHTPGSVVAWVDTFDKGRVLFGQDVHGPFAADFDSDLIAWRDRMHKLLALEADVLCEGHLGIYRGKDKVRSFIEKQLAENG